MGGRPDITSEFTFKSCLNHFQQQIHPSKSATKLFVGKEKQQNLMKHPKLESGTHGHQEDGHVQHS